MLLGTKTINIYLCLLNKHRFMANVLNDSAHSLTLTLFSWQRRKQFDLEITRMISNRKIYLRKNNTWWTRKISLVTILAYYSLDKQLLDIQNIFSQNLQFMNIHSHRYRALHQGSRWPKRLLAVCANDNATKSSSFYKSQIYITL